MWTDYDVKLVDKKVGHLPLKRTGALAYVFRSFSFLASTGSVMMKRTPGGPFLA